MSNSQDSDKYFRPLEVNRLLPGQPIVTGGETSDIGYRGVVDLAYNNNTLYAQAAPYAGTCFSSDTTQGGVTSAATTAEGAVAFWMPLMPASERTSMTILVQTGGFAVSGSGTGTVTAKVYTGTTASTGTATFTSGLDNNAITVTGLDLPANEYAKVEIWLNVDTATDSVELYSVKATQTPVSSAATEVTDLDSLDDFIPADVGRFGADYPLTVDGVRDLSTSAVTLYKWARSTPGLFTFSQTAITTQSNNIHDTSSDGHPIRMVYRRRPGFSKLRFYIEGYTDGWTSGDGAKFDVYASNGLNGFAANAGLTQIEFAKSAATIFGNPSSVNWEHEGDIELDLSGYGGFVEVVIRPTSAPGGTTGRITNFTMIEAV